MDPKLRPSFADIVRTLEEILNRLRNEDSERKFLNLDNSERKPKGKCVVQTLLQANSKRAQCFVFWRLGFQLYMVLLTAYELFCSKPENDSGTMLWEWFCKFL